MRISVSGIVFACLHGCAFLAGCGSSGSSSGDEPEVRDPVVVPSLAGITVSGIADDLGNFDPARV